MATRKMSAAARKKTPAADNAGFGPEDELAAYRDMLLIRRFEEKAGQLYGMGYIGGFCHLYIGQEAVVVGMQMVLKEGDQVITSYRDHGHMLATGMDPKGVMAELTGRKGGYSKGKGGSMHMFSREKNFYGGHGIVAAQVPIGAGLAFSNRYRGNDHVSVTYFGEGVANQGQVYESFNMAALWKLPVIFVIENNRYAHGYRGHPLGSQGRGGLQSRLGVRHPRSPSERHGCARCQGSGRRGGRPVPRRQGPGHPRDDDLPLSRPFHVGPGQIPHEGRGAEDARGARPDRAGETPAHRGRHGGGRAEEDHGEVRARVTEAAEFAQNDPEPDAAELWTDIYVEARS